MFHEVGNDERFCLAVVLLFFIMSFGHAKGAVGAFGDDKMALIEVGDRNISTAFWRVPEQVFCPGREKVMACSKLQAEIGRLLSGFLFAGSTLETAGAGRLADIHGVFPVNDLDLQLLMLCFIGLSGKRESKVVDPDLDCRIFMISLQGF